MREPVGVLCALLALAGCSTSSDPSRGSGSPSLNGGSGGGGSGAAGASGAAGVSGFGNPDPNQMLPPITPMEDAGSRCQPGVFCPPDTVDNDDCGSLELETDVEVIVTPGNLLVVFDQSASMNDGWGATNKLQAAQDALTAALTPLQDSLTVGAILFPTLACIPFLPPAMGGHVAPITDPLQISFRPGAEFLAVWNGLWPGGEGSGIGTPVNEAMDRAAVALQEAAGTLTGVTAVMLFTDGEPNCFPDAMLQGIPTALETVHAANWLSGMPSIKTYVVGLPGASGVTLLNDVAVAGGTMSYITPDDPAVLEAKINEIVQSTVKMGFDSCTLTLDPPAAVPEKLHVVVEEPMVGEQLIPRDLGGGSGWSINAAGDTVELLGQICEDAKAGRFTSIKFKYGCVEPPEIPPVVVE